MPKPSDTQNIEPPSYYQEKQPSIHSHHDHPLNKSMSHQSRGSHKLEELAELTHLDIKLKPMTYEWWCEVRASTLSIIFTVSFAVFTDIFVYSIIVPIIPFVLQHRLGVDVSQVQQSISKILALYAVGLVVGSLVFGYIADKLTHRRFIMLIGLFLLAGSTFILLFSKTLWLYMVGRVAQGLSASVVWVVGLAIVADTATPSNISYLMGFPGIGLSVAMFMGPLIGGIVYDKAGYNEVFIVCFALLAFDIALRLFMLEKSQIKVIRAKQAEKHVQNFDSLEPHLQEYVKKYLPESSRHMLTAKGTELLIVEQEEVSEPEPEYKFYINIWNGKQIQVPAYVKLMLNTRIMVAFYTAVVMAWVMTAFETILTFYVEEHFHFSALKASLLLLAIAGPSFGEPLVGHLSDKIGPRYIVFFAMILATPPLILLRIPSKPTAGHIALLSVLLVLIGVCLSCLFAPVTGEFSNAVCKFESKRPGCLGKGKGYGQSYGLFNVAWSLGSLIGPFAASGAVVQSGWGMAVLSLGILTFCSAFITFPFIGGNLIIARRRRRESSEPIEA